MKKIANMTKRKLVRLLKQRCPESLTDDTKRVIKSDYEQLRRTNRFKMEVFETESIDGVNSIYDFIVSKDGLPVIQTLRDALRTIAVPATSVFITPNKFHVGIPFLIIVNSKANNSSIDLGRKFLEFIDWDENRSEQVRLLLEAIEGKALPLTDPQSGAPFVRVLVRLRSKTASDWQNRLEKLGFSNLSWIIQGRMFKGQIPADKLSALGAIPAIRKVKLLHSSQHVRQQLGI